MLKCVRATVCLAFECRTSCEVRLSLTCFEIILPNLLNLPTANMGMKLDFRKLKASFSTALCGSAHRPAWGKGVHLKPNREVGKNGREWPEMDQNGPKWAQMGPKMGPNGPKWAKMEPQMGRNGLAWSPFWPILKSILVHHPSRVILVICCLHANCNCPHSDTASLSLGLVTSSLLTGLNVFFQLLHNYD